MEDLTLMALLECPLCLEQLDATAKVLPCQHTFCMTCLQKQETTHSLLLCPECQVPVPFRTVEELPENILLARLLEGFQGRNSPRAHHAAPMAWGSSTVREPHQRESQHREKQGYSEVSA